MILNLVEELAKYADNADERKVIELLEEISVSPQKFANDFVNLARSFIYTLNAIEEGLIPSENQKVASDVAETLLNSLINYTAVLRKIAQEGGEEASDALADLLSYMHTLNMEQEIEQLTESTLNASADLFDSTQTLAGVVIPEIIEVIKQLTGYDDVVVAKVLNIYSKLMIPVYAELHEAVPLIFELTSAKITDLGLQALNEVSPIVGHEDEIARLDDEVQSLITSYSSGNIPSDASASWLFF